MIIDRRRKVKVKETTALGGKYPTIDLLTVLLLTFEYPRYPTTTGSDGPGIMLARTLMLIKIKNQENHTGKPALEVSIQVDPLNVVYDRKITHNDRLGQA